MRNHKILTQLPGELEHAVKCRCNQSFTEYEIAKNLQDIRKRKTIERYSPYKVKCFREKQSFRVHNKDKTREKVAEVTKNKNSCQNCGSKNTHNSPNEKKKIYSIGKLPEDSESDSMGDAIRENSDYDLSPIQEFLVEYQEETQFKLQDINLEEVLPQETGTNTHRMHRPY
ncbi:hypothetical protein O181_005004 [Austropuccinia psidii MF-1]|uniref:Uncharacterized protein n=1 Tax=Austropuccinia psidii MF-1 TaxID=1389203 RepID=A0A9Q3BHB3_9BASI|nr:hypothetical protein [Austropuccinia psidii MF-1]